MDKGNQKLQMATGIILFMEENVLFSTLIMFSCGTSEDKTKTEDFPLPAK
jgi:hypothetical protein